MYLTSVTKLLWQQLQLIHVDRSMWAGQTKGRNIGASTKSMEVVSDQYKKWKIILNTIRSEVGIVFF